MTHRKREKPTLLSPLLLLTPPAFHFAQAVDQAAAMFGFFAAIVVSCLIVEPINVVFLSALPALVDEESRCGRFLEKIRWTYLEFFSP